MLGFDHDKRLQKTAVRVRPRKNLFTMRVAKGDVRIPCHYQIVSARIKGLRSKPLAYLSNVLSSTEAAMPYANGETPVLGDYVKNDFEQPGTVTRLRMASSGEDFVCIRWDDGGLDSPLTPAREFTLISRRA